MAEERVKVLVDQQCFWLRNALTTEEQIEVFSNLLECSKHTDNTSKPCMNPSPKTLIFDGPTPTLRFGRFRTGDEDNNSSSSPLTSVYDRLILQRAISLVSPRLRDGFNNNGPDSAPQQLAYNRYSVGVIRYKAPDDRFAEHIDHCNEPNGWVILLSLGCTARFMVAGPSDTAYRTIDMLSGDILLFDPSSQAAIRHGVASIVVSSCPSSLIEAFGDNLMGNYRYGVQCRTSLQNST